MKSFDLEEALEQAMATDAPVPAGCRPGTADLLDAMGLVDPDAVQAPAGKEAAPGRPKEPKADPLEREVKGPLLKRLLELRAENNSARETWPADWFDQTDVAQVVACQRLWGSVLHASLLELFRKVRAARQMPAHKQPGHERSALAWVGTRDFREVCDLAGFEAGQVATWVRAEAASEAPGAVLLNRGTTGADA